MEDSSCDKNVNVDDKSFKASLQAMMSPLSCTKHIPLNPSANTKLPSEQVQDILLANKMNVDKTIKTDVTICGDNLLVSSLDDTLLNMQSSNDPNISLYIDSHDSSLNVSPILLNQITAASNISQSSDDSNSLLTMPTNNVQLSHLLKTSGKSGEGSTVFQQSKLMAHAIQNVHSNPNVSHQAFKFHSENIQKRRSSTRSIKRKKFDDELVESSLIKSERNRGMKPTSDIKSDIIEQPSPVNIIPSENLLMERKRTYSSKPLAIKQAKRHKPPPIAASTKDLGRWKPQDDLALITNVQQTNDLTAVHLGVKFSCHFTLREVQERWYALLYYPVLSKIAMSAIKQLHPDVIASIQAKALFCKEEEELLGTISSTSQPTIEIFEELLMKNPTLFYLSRNAKSLQNHWILMKQYHLLPDQSVQPMPRGDHVLNFSDAEDLINDDELKDGSDEHLEHELTVADRKQKKEIRHLEQEVPKWQVLVDSVTGVSPPDFDNQTLAVLRGRLVRYLMRSREITLGRATKDNPIDVDLSLEGPAWKISRRQGVIKLRNSGAFYIANEGKRPFYVDGKPILYNNKQRLNNSSVVEISCLRFIFLINQDLINVIRNDSTQRISS